MTPKRGKRASKAQPGMTPRDLRKHAAEHRAMMKVGLMAKPAAARKAKRAPKRGTRRSSR